MTTAAAAAAGRLTCSTLRTLAARLPASTRLSCIDVTPTHISLALSDDNLRHATPFGVLARTSSAAKDASILVSATSSLPPIHGVIVNTPPGAANRVATYVKELLADSRLLPHANSLLFYSESVALLRAVNSAVDVHSAASDLTDAAESRRISAFDNAMYGRVDNVELPTDRPSRAKISAAEVLQACLDDLARIEQNK